MVSNPKMVMIGFKPRVGKKTFFAFSYSLPIPEFQASVDIGGSQSDLNVLGIIKITAKYGTGYKSDIAIDDFLLIPDSCTI